MLKTTRVCAFFALAVGLGACATAPKTSAQREQLQTEADTALRSMYQADPTLSDVVKSAYGYAIFPSVGKGGFIVGGGYGRGVVYKKGERIGYADVSSADVGALAGGQTIRELLVFKDEQAFNDLVNSRFSLTAGASAVALKPGAATQTQFENGVAVFVQPTGGLMGSLAVGGQSFSFVPNSAVGTR